MNFGVLISVFSVSLLPPTIFLVYKEFIKNGAQVDYVKIYDDYPKTLKPEMLSSPGINRFSYSNNLIAPLLIGLLLGATLILPVVFQGLKITHDYVFGSTYIKSVKVFDSGCDYTHKVGVRCFVMAKHNGTNLKLNVSKKVLDDIKGKSVKLKYKGSAIGTSITHYQIIQN
jgi:hypothetical protein